ncbi:hypothetical protein ACC732_15680 [Rhizobium ruizarguesonis]
MVTQGEIDGIERRLKSAIVAFNKKKVAGVSLVEAIDDALLWPSIFDQLVPIVPSFDLDRLIARAPLFICAVAAEIGFRFEGVGTVFWSKFSDALGLNITMVHRQRIADVFKAEALRYNLSRPTESAFSSHFSIIAWPIANALLPVDLVGPVTRLIARAPVAALPAPGRSINFPSLRAWASAAEGARLTDWLRFEGPTTRVLTALLTENRNGTLPEASYTRLRDAIAVDSEAIFAARAAQLRVRNAKPTTTLERTLGRLSLVRDATGIRLFASWPSLPPALYDDARNIARSVGWRPRLWDTGSFLHPDAALSAGPFLIASTSIPSHESPAYPDAAAIFGKGTDMAVALASRSIEWDANLLFDANDERTQAEQRFDVPTGATGHIWLGIRADGVALHGLKKLGTAAGYSFFEANLADPAARAILTRERLLSANTRFQLARHPVDAIGAPHGVVRPNRPFLFYREGTDSDDAPEILPSNGRIAAVPGPAGRPALRTEAPPSPENSVVDFLLFERDTVFEALVEKRLQLRVESRLPLVNVAVSIDLEIGGRLVARGREYLPALPLTVPAFSKLLAPVYEDVVRKELLESGEGLLRIWIGRSQAVQIRLERPLTSIEWDDDGPQLVGAAMDAVLVEATAQTPHRFTTSMGIAIPSRGARAYGLLLSNGRLADPIQIFASKIFDYGDFAANFGDDIGSRRIFDHGRGAGDIARARIAWARALCTSLAAIGAKGRILRQFEEPLVVDLCGRAWWLAEQASKKGPADPHEALWQSALESGLASLPNEASADQAAVFAKAFIKHARIVDPDWPSASDLPLDGAMDDALNAGFSEAVTSLHAIGDLLNVEDDFDFGAPSEDWEAAANKAMRTIRRTMLARQIAPSEGGKVLSRRNYAHVSVGELAEDLAAWTKKFALPRGQLSAEVAAGALQFWISPAVCDDVDAVVRVLANDPFVSRATRYMALRVGPTISAGAE